MSTERLAARAAEHLRYLCVDLPTRTVGSQGNRDATAYFGGVCRAAGWDVQSPAFQCLEWSESGAELTAGAVTFEAQVGPFSLPVQVSAPLVSVNTVEQLEAADLRDKVVLLRGEIAAQQLAPKNFPWWNPEEHQRIIAGLERGAPAAIIAATGRNPETAGGQYPFPLIEDGDFNIPSVYMTEEEGQKLAVYAGREVDLEIRSSRTVAEGFNVTARTAPQGEGLRYIVTAHIDAKPGTPGAIDNGGGVVILLLLAELLAGKAPVKVDLVPFNGEDYYAAPGQRLYLQQNPDLTSVGLAINIDGAGYHKGATHFSLYNCPDETASALREIFGKHGLAEGPEWYQGDHSIFVMAGRPAVAITSELLEELGKEITHTPQDTVAIVDPERLAQAALAIEAVVRSVKPAGA